MAQREDSKKSPTVPLIAMIIIIIIIINSYQSSISSLQLSMEYTIKLVRFSVSGLVRAEIRVIDCYSSVICIKLLAGIWLSFAL